MKGILRTFVAAICVHLIGGLPARINIGGLFESFDTTYQTAFEFAVNAINSNNVILPDTTLSADIENIEPMNSFHAAKKACTLLNRGVVAILGPQSAYTSPHIGSICDSLDVPHIETRWDYKRRIKDFSINLYPHWDTLSGAYRDLVLAKGWMSFTILFEEDEALIRLRKLLQVTTNKKMKIEILKLNNPYRTAFKELKKKAVTNIVLDCKTSNIREILKQAQQVGVMTDYHNYVITSLDVDTVDMEEFRHGGTNITAFQLVDPENKHVKEVVNWWTFGNPDIMEYQPRNTGSSSVLKEIKIDTQTALIYDAVTLLALSLHELDRSQSIKVDHISCDNGVPWTYGGSLNNYMKMTQIDGLTGTVRFDQNGFRSHFKLNIIELTRRGLRKTGEWNETHGITFVRNYNDTITEVYESLKNKTLKVTTILIEPYTMLKESWRKLKGNDRYEGYCLDLLNEISKKLHFKYEIHINPDETAGQKNVETNQWSGMIGELINGTADLAIADLTITYEREEVVDFTMPFMNLGVSILFKKPSKTVPKLFSFLSPLSWDVWIYMATAYIGVSIFLFILARFSPYEWQSPHPCVQDSEVLENNFTLMNSLWFTVGSLMQQGSDIAPSAWSTRMVAGTWWFFTLIMISSYTANLAAFLTVQRMVSPIESAEDLAKQTKIKYGCYKGGSTMGFFKASKIITYQRMWAFMDSARPSVFVNSAKEGVDKVRQGNYAYLMESTTIEYITQRECELTQIGGWLDSKGYGIATPHNSPYRTVISSAILQLQEETLLDVLKIKWWKQKRGGNNCEQEGEKSITNELSLANVGGVFVVLLGGLGCSGIVAVIEFIWKSRRESEERRESLCMEMLRELKFAISCESSTRVTNNKKKNENLPIESGGYNIIPMSKYMKPEMS